MDSDADSDEDAKAAKGALCEYFDGKEKENDGKGGISKEDAFLRDYLLNEKWKENEDAREGTTLNFIGGGTGESSEEEVEEAAGAQEVEAEVAVEVVVAVRSMLW